MSKMRTNRNRTLRRKARQQAALDKFKASKHPRAWDLRNAEWEILPERTKRFISEWVRE